MQPDAHPIYAQLAAIMASKDAAAIATLSAEVDAIYCHLSLAASADPGKNSHSQSPL